MRDEIVTLDGPAGAGKSTIAKLIANALGFKYLDTGATYRAVTLYIIENMIDINDKESLMKALSSLVIDFDENGKIYLNKNDVSKAIRTKTINSFVSPVSALKEIRESMVSLQRQIAEKGKYVVDGRDIGGIVFPNAKYKFYIDANANERARRRYQEEISKGIKTTFEEVKKSVLARDKYDMSRKESPLKVPENADVIDTSLMSINDVVAEVVLRCNVIKQEK